MKFCTFCISYVLFLLLYAYVAMLKKEDTTIGTAEYILWLFVCSYAIEELHQMIRHDSTSLRRSLTLYISSFWNILDVTAISIFALAVVLRLQESTVEYGHLLYAIDAWFWVLRLLNVFYANRIIGPYVLIIGKMFKDMLYFITILLVFTLAYGVVTTAILQPQDPSYLMIRDVIFKPYFNIYGELFLEEGGNPGMTLFGTPVINDYAEGITWVFLGIYLLIANVLLLNLLIAIFGNTFLKVQEKSDEIWKFRRFALVYEYKIRPAFMPPFILLEHFFLFMRWVYKTLKKRFSTEDVVQNLERKYLYDKDLEDFETNCVVNLLHNNSLYGNQTKYQDMKEIGEKISSLQLNINLLKEWVKKQSDKNPAERVQKSKNIFL